MIPSITPSLMFLRISESWAIAGKAVVGHPFPAVCIRTSTERPEALDKACFDLAGIDEKSLLQAVTTAVDMNENGDYGIPVPDYTEESVSTVNAGINMTENAG